MTVKHCFVEGMVYENRRGSFKIICIQDQKMRIQFDDGEQVNTTISDQARILGNMEREQQARQPAKSQRPKYPRWYGSSFTGFQDSDFKDDVTGTRWRSREHLGGAVTARLNSDQIFSSWAIYGQPNIHWATLKHRDPTHTHVQAKFLITLNPHHLNVGFYIERDNQEGAARKDWNSFLKWLSGNNNAHLIHQVMLSHNLQILDPYRLVYPTSLKLMIVPTQAGFEIKNDHESLESFNPEELPKKLEYLALVHSDHWLNILCGRCLTKSTVLASGSDIVSQIVDIFNVLLPAYENVARAYP